MKNPLFRLLAALFISLLMSSGAALAQGRCVQLFPESGTGTSGAVSVRAQKSVSITNKTVALDQLFSDFGFLGPAYKDLFLRDESGTVNFRQAGRTLKNSLAALPKHLQEPAALKILNAIEKSESVYNSEHQAQFRMLRTALQENGGRSWVNQTLKLDRPNHEVLATAQFVLEFNPALRDEMIHWSFYFYSSAKKTFVTYVDPFERNTKLPPKRALLLFMKVALNWPDQLMSKSKKGVLKASDYADHIQAVADQIQTHTINSRPIPAQALLAGLKQIQTELIEQSKASPGDFVGHQSEPSVVVDGSFPNGLAINYNSDIDLIIINSSLRQRFVSDEYRIKRDIYEAMRKQGYLGSTLPLQNIVHEAPEFFPSSAAAVEFGHLGTLTFEIFKDRIEVIIYSINDSKTLSQNYQRFTFDLEN